MKKATGGDGIPVELFQILKDVFSDQCKEIEENNRMGKTRDLFKKIRDTKVTFHAKMGSIKDRNGMDLTEAEDIKKRWQEYTEELYKKDLHDPDNYDAAYYQNSVSPLKDIHIINWELGGKEVSWAFGLGSWAGTSWSCPLTQKPSGSSAHYLCGL